MTSRKSIYESLVGKCVQVEYREDTDTVFGKLTQANQRLLELQPSFHISSYRTETRRKDSVIKEGESLSAIEKEMHVDLEQIAKRFKRNCRMVIDASTVRTVTDITTIFKDEWKLI